MILYPTPKTYISDITVITEIQGKSGIINYEIKVEGQECNKKEVRITVIDKEGKKVAENIGKTGILEISDAQFWEPANPYLYTLMVETIEDGVVDDVYTLPVGIRTVKVEGNKLLLNGKPIYLKGFGKHEDADIRGKGYIL